MEPSKIIGVVTDCRRLNIRDRPSFDSEIITTVDCLSEVMIDKVESTDEFYKICTASGIEGFCVQKYVSICE